MNSKLTKDMTVGSMVAEDFNRAQVLERLGIDYCCHGSDTLEAACQKKGLNADDVLDQLDGREVTGNAPDFASWPLDLLVDKVARVHGPHHPELLEVRQAVAESFEELDSHFAKEENVLFPQLYEIYQSHEEGRPAAPFHCGTISHPIRQMMLEHDQTGEMWQHISDLTHEFTTPADGCASYRLMSQQLKQFFLDLKEHISLENNLIFPGFIKMEEQCC